MTYSVKKISSSQVLVTVTVSADDLTSVKQKTLHRLAKDMKVAGFRPGKVPANVAEKNLDANVLNAELLEDAVNLFTIDAFEKEKLTPLDRPKVDIKKFVPGQELEYTAEVEIIPDIKLGDYKKLKAKKEKAEVADSDVQEVIDRMRQGMATKNDVDRAAKDGDEVVIDFVGTDQDGKEVAGATGKDYPLALGSNTFIPGFEEGLVGKKAGDKFALPLTFPKDYQHKPLAGAKVNFAVTVNAVKEVALPELNDEFAAKTGPFKTVDEFKADIRRELIDQKEREAVDKLKDSLVEQLVKASDVPTPEVLVTDQVAAIERDFVQNLMYRGMTLEQYLEQQGTTKEQWRNKELREQAIRRVQVGLALAELSKAERIEVSIDDLNARMQELLNYYNDPSMREQLDTPEARRDLANRLLTEKTVDRLVELNTK
ncbi:MAG: trigger factor [Candidatus Saccharimonadales bacterium]